MFPRFFIDRPIFATVLSIVITLAGVIAVYRLPMAQYPPVAPPTVSVGCSYPGASAQVVAETVAVPIEEQVNGVEDMLYKIKAHRLRLHLGSRAPRAGQRSRRTGALVSRL